MPRLMALQQAFDQWEAEIKPAVVAHYGENDEGALAESWNDFTDDLCKKGFLTGLQYHICPTYYEDMPEDDLRACLLHLVDRGEFTYSHMYTILKMAEDLI